MCVCVYQYYKQINEIDTIYKTGCPTFIQIRVTIDHILCGISQNIHILNIAIFIQQSERNQFEGVAG